MCGDCGCGESGARMTALDVTGEHETGGHETGGHETGGHETGGHSHHHHRPTRTVTIEQAVLAGNDALAAENRAWLAARGITAVNLMSSPGSGKTTVLERTIRDLRGTRDVRVVEGDQETVLDAERIRATGCAVVQINTGGGCHLDAGMLAGALRTLDPPNGSLLFVENVGNLVCPALFDLGESARAVIISVTEGDDKPLKYPHMFAVADVVLINKVDLLPYVDFDLDRCTERARSIRPGVEVIPVSATTGAGTDAWLRWVAAR